jgi:RNAse (barnase) inhibitor barstar
MCSLLHGLLSERLSFPDYYGANWDAFRDVITAEDVLPHRLTLRGWAAFEQRLPREARLMKQCLEDYRHERPDAPCEVTLA